MAAKKVTKKAVPVTKEKAEKKDKIAKTNSDSKKVAFTYRLTEKSNRMSEQSVFVLNVPKTATKLGIIASLKNAYKVTPLAVRIVNVPTKVKMRRTGAGTHGGGKKAYITLKKGETIAL
jgi:large subunit ribosomal protein L23